MRTDSIKKYVIPNIPYLFILWACLKLGTAYRLAPGADFAHKLMGLGQSIGPAFADFAPGLAPFDWLIGIVGAVGFRLLIYFKSKNAKKFRRDEEYGSARWGTEKDIKPFVDPKFENNVILTKTEFLTMNTRPNSAANPYAIDYQDLSSLKALADRYRVAILAIHHIRKMQDDDPFNRISGTTGISGVADTNLVLLKQGRSSVEATLHCVGRDVEYRELHLKFQNCRWLLTEPLEEQKQGPVSPEVLRLAEFLKGLESFDGTATELAALWEGYAGEPVQPSVLSKKLARYAGELDRLGIRITTSRTRESRSLHLRCDSSDGSDGKNGTEPVSDLLSQPSHLSPAQPTPL